MSDKNPEKYLQEPESEGPCVFVNVHLVSDSTGETLGAIMRATIARFENFRAVEHSYYLVRSRKQLLRVFEEIDDRPGIVMCTLFNSELKQELIRKCEEGNIPCIPVLDPSIEVFSEYLGQKQSRRIGHLRMNEPGYTRRIEAMNFVLTHDDGQGDVDLEEADVVLVGVSRTSKTPTSVYLANRGLKVANIPLVPGVTNVEALVKLKKPLVIGLKINPERLVQIRRNRLLSISESRHTDYVDELAVRQEVLASIRIFERNHWPVIDVTRRSVEETAAAILNLHAEKERA